MNIQWGWAALSLSLAVGIAGAVHAAEKGAEHYKREPMPPGFQVIATELDGPVFADERGRTVYTWPKQALRNGDAGDLPSKPSCTDHIYRGTSGYASPYPADLELPEVDRRPSCMAVWPPVRAADNAQEIGKWKPVDRPDGGKQWSYDGYPLYTSVLDEKPGDVLGGSTMFQPVDVGTPLRYPAVPAANVPPQFKVESTMSGRMIVQTDGFSVYSFDGDGRNKSNCDGACLAVWQPVGAGEYAQPIGEWTIFERSPGVRQWAFRGKPVYRHLDDRKTVSQDGSDVPGWQNVYMQRTPQLPKGFTLKDTMIGVVLGDEQGRSLYRYMCTDDAPDQLACDHPDAPQVYRFKVCGGGDPDQCVRAFPYVIAPRGAKSGSNTWGTMYIDPKTGKKAAPEAPGALHVWTFRARPIYTFAGNSKGYGDHDPADIKAQGWGEWSGARNGFKVMAFRDVYSQRDQ